MGWSCSVAADNTMRVWVRACRESTGSSNTYITNSGEYFFELSRREYDDGSITGSIWKIVEKIAPDTSRAKPAGSFRIEGDGTITRAPKFLKDCVKKAIQEHGSVPRLYI
jgi:hypothetical protein